MTVTRQKHLYPRSLYLGHLQPSLGTSSPPGVLLTVYLPIFGLLLAYTFSLLPGSSRVLSFGWTCGSWILARWLIVIWRRVRASFRGHWSWPWWPRILTFTGWAPLWRWALLSLAFATSLAVFFLVSFTRAYQLSQKFFKSLAFLWFAGLFDGSDFVLSKPQKSRQSLFGEPSGCFGDDICQNFEVVKPFVFECLVDGLGAEEYELMIVSFSVMGERGDRKVEWQQLIVEGLLLFVLNVRTEDHRSKHLPEDEPVAVLFKCLLPYHHQKSLLDHGLEFFRFQQRDQ